MFVSTSALNSIKYQSTPITGLYITSTLTFWILYRLLKNFWFVLWNFVLLPVLVPTSVNVLHAHSLPVSFVASSVQFTCVCSCLFQFYSGLVPSSCLCLLWICFVAFSWISTCLRSSFFQVFGSFPSNTNVSLCLPASSLDPVNFTWTLSNLQVIFHTLYYRYYYMNLQVWTEAK